MTINRLKINLLLAEQNLTKAALAERSGICRQNISAILRRGTCEPRTVWKLATALNVPMEDIIAKEEYT